jgi:uncharacterized paraquat-inducible protein A
MSRLQRIRRFARHVLAICLVSVATLSVPRAAGACPTCKDGIAQSDSQQQLARGYYYSILFMMSMPFVLLAVFGIRIWLSARRRAATEAR